MNVLLALAHSIEERDQVELFTRMGLGVFSLGGYIDPAHPHDPVRPGVPNALFHPELKAVVDALNTPDNLGAAKARIPEPLLDWADVLICHHHEQRWLVPQWPRLRDWIAGGRKRVVWRTVGQSVASNEAAMAPLRAEGLQVVRYSPLECNIPGYVGGDAMIRFWKDPEEWSGWTGGRRVVLTIGQHLKRRHPWTNWLYWEQATAGLPRLPVGYGSEEIGGPGVVPYGWLREALRLSRAFVFTGTQPASYTLGLVEAMMTGTPIVSIGPSHMTQFPYGPELFEGHLLAPLSADDPEEARALLRRLLRDEAFARETSLRGRTRAVAEFGYEPVAAAWRAFLGASA